MSTPARSVRSLAESYWAAEAQRDVDAVMAHYHSDATYQDAGGRRHGAAEIRAFYAGSVSDYPGLRVDILGEHPAPEGAALEFEAILTDHAGRDWVIRGVNVFQVDGDRFTVGAVL